MKRHTYILGKTGSGKSEIIKNIWFDLQKKSNVRLDKSLVCIEPQGKLSVELLQFYLNNENRERLIYLDTHIRETAKELLGKDIIQEDYIFALNPLDITDKSERNIKYLTDQLTAVFFSLLEKSDSSDLMDLVLSACINVLLRTDGDIVDLIDFMNDEKNAPLIAKGRNIENQIHRQTISDLESKKGRDIYKQTKKSVRARLLKLVKSSNALNVLKGQSTVNLGSSIEQGKVIICNLRQGLLSEDVSIVLGKFLVALIQTEIKKRPLGKRPKPTFVIVDEAQNFITPKVSDILAKERQKGLHMILAHQYFTQIEDTHIRDGIIANTAIKLASKNEPKSLEVMAKQMAIKTQDFQKLKKYHFYINDSYNEKGTRQFKAPAKYVDIKPPFYVDKKELEELFLWLVNDSGYYVKLSEIKKTARKEAGFQSFNDKTEKEQEPYTDPFSNNS